VEEPDTQYLWNDRKAQVNLNLHHVGFDEAATVFQDPHAVMMYDEDHSEDETREIILGYSNKQRLLFVSFTERKPKEIRLISARLATRTERKKYEDKDK